MSSRSRGGNRIPALCPDSLAWPAASAVPRDTMPAIHRAIRALAFGFANRGDRGMKGIVHPLSDQLGGLVENDMQGPPDAEPENDTSWRWMVAIAVVIGLFAWFTR